MADFTLTIGNKNYSSWSLRAWLACRLAGCDFEETVIPLREKGSGEAILKVSPSGKVPVLTHHRVTVWDSLAICEYLAECFPNARLWPGDPAARAMARAVSAEMHAGFPDLRRNMPMNMRATLSGKGMTPEVQADINRVTALWRECRKRFSGGADFLFGDVTIADAMFAPLISRFYTYGVELDSDSRRYAEAVWALPDLREWVVDAKKEPWIVPAFEI